MVAFKEYFDEKLAQILADKIIQVYPQFDTKTFLTRTRVQVRDLELKARIEVITDLLHELLPQAYPKALDILVQILGEENQKETGMFTEFYWIMPIAFFVEKYGVSHVSESIKALEEITKRNTSEYAVRPFIRTYPQKMLKTHVTWSKSQNVHVRRLASEGLRPKLPWATKLDVFTITEILPVLENLKEDSSKFVQKSVANTLRDYCKIQPKETLHILQKWSKSTNPHTKWIVKHAIRKNLISLP